MRSDRIVKGDRPRVVITGIGMVTGLGPDRETTWQSLSEGAGAVRWLDTRDLMQRIGSKAVPKELPRIAGAPAAFEAPVSDDPYLGEPNIHLAVTAAKEAVADAQVDWERVPQYRRGCVIGTSKGGIRSIGRALAERRCSDHVKNFTPELWPMFWPNAPASLVAARWNIQGPVLCPVAACATGLMSLCRGAELIEHGTCDVVLAGSTDASLEPAVLGAFSRMGVMAKDFEDPASACRPFDRFRSGFVVGEGAAVLVLERAELASARGVKPYAEWLAGGCVSDPTGIAHLETEGTSLSWLISEVLRRSNTSASQIDYINLHGTGTKDNDRAETRAIQRALGAAAEDISCSSLKGALGHLLGAAGSVETACTLLAMRDGCVPPTRNLTQPDPECDLDYTPGIAKPRHIGKAMKLSLGFGGHQVAAVLGRVSDS